MNDFEIKVSLAVSHYHNNDGDESDEPYNYRGTTTASLDEIRASIGDWKGDWHHARETVPANFDPKELVRGPIYVVLVHFDTGDTFGSDGRIYSVAAFETDEKASELCRLIEKNEEVNGYDEIVFENVSIYPGPWKGYFEHINYIESRMVILEY